MDWTNRLRLRNLRSLIVIDATRNLSRAAVEIGISQPALSKWLSELEHDIGLPLFERNPRGLSPTTYGKVLIDHARRVEAHLGLAAAEMAAMRAGSTGRVVIGSAGSSGRDTVPLAALLLLKLFPKTSISMVEAPIATLMEHLKSGDIDILVGRSSVENPGDPIRHEVLHSEAVSFVVRRGHPLSGVRDVGWEDLRRFPWLVWPGDLAIQRQVDTALERAGVSMPAIVLQSDSITLNLSILKESDFVGTASLRAAERFSDLGLLDIVAFDPLGPSKVAMYWREENVPRHAVKAMIDCLRAVVARTAREGE